MAIWLVRAGGHGEYETKFLTEERVYLTWDSLTVNLQGLNSRDALQTRMSLLYPDDKPKRVMNHARQIWSFAHDMQPGDWVVLPLKAQRTIQIGEVIGDYAFHMKAENPFFHSRAVKWIGESIPRANFGKDLLNTFGAFLTICRIQSNNAEERVQAMQRNKWQPETIASITKLAKTTKSSQLDTIGISSSSSDALDGDLEEAAQDKIAKLIQAKFKGHGLARLVEAILIAQGYTTYLSPEGADGGADILAGAGPLGFGAPRLCVEVKSEDGAIDRETVDKLIGAISKFRAEQGLFVAWGGFKSTVQKELAGSFFNVRLWTQKELLEALFTHYDKLSDDIKAELPLKRIWTVVVPGEE